MKTMTINTVTVKAVETYLLKKNEFSSHLNAVDTHKMNKPLKKRGTSSLSTLPLNKSIRKAIVEKPAMLAQKIVVISVIIS